MKNTSGLQPLKRRKLNFLSISSRIAKRLLIWTAIVGSVGALILSIAEYYFDYNKRIKELTRSLNAIGRISVPSLAQSTWVFDQEQVRLQLKGLSSLPSVTIVQVHFKQGDPIQFGKDFKGDSIIRRSFQLNYEENESHHYLGELILIKNIREDRKDMVYKWLITLGGNAIVIFIISMTVTLAYQAIVTRRLVSVSRQTRNVSASELRSTLSQPPETDSVKIRDELDEISQAIATLKYTGGIALRDASRKEARYRAVIESISEGVFTLNRYGRIISANPAAENMLGYDQSEMVGCTFNDMECTKKNTDLTNILKDIEKSIGQTFEIYITHKQEDRSFPGELIISPMAVPDDIRYVAILLNIKERKNAENMGKQLGAITESAQDAIIMMNPQGDISYWNQAAEKILGYRRKEVLGKNLHKLLAPERFHEDHLKFFPEFKRSGRGRAVGKTLELQATRKDGQEIPVAVSLSAVSLHGEFHAVGIMRDITERKQLEEQIRQSQKMESIGKLAGGIAHDFNNILYPIVGNTEMLLEDIPKDSPLRNNLNEVFTGAMRAKELVKKILAFSRQDSHEIKLMRMQPVIKEALTLIRSTIPASIEIKQTINSDCGIIKADPTQIHQIVMNLATNAYHAMEDTGGELKVNLKEVDLGEQDLPGPNMEPGPYACLIVADSGTGINDNVIEKIFDPYFTTKEQGKGSGMGLSVVHGIVKMSGGSIQLYSQLGKGTEFHVYLPIVKSSFEQQEAQPKEPIQGGTERILLVDDEDAIAFMEKQMLERLGYSVVSRTSSVGALEAFLANPDKFDLVITDMAMPNMSGDKLASELIKIRPGIPILLCTGFSEKLPEEKAKSLGIKGFLMKPIIKKDLSEKIREVLDEGQEK